MLSKLLLLFLSIPAFAQIDPSTMPVLSEQAPNAAKATVRESLQTILDRNNNGLPNVVLIGYWPPTNEMVREFSPYQAGWVGLNWENRGYNVYAFMPEFPNGTVGSNGKGTGDFEVDYQDTSRDFWDIVPKVKPVAIMSFGRAYANKDWEMEAISYNLTNWMDDYYSTRKPDRTPPESGFQPNGERSSAIPSMYILNGLNKGMPGTLNAFVSKNGGGNFLCGYLGHHLNWYRALHQEVKISFHTHIGSASSLTNLKLALKIQVRQTILKLKSLALGTGPHIAN